MECPFWLKWKFCTLIFSIRPLTETQLIDSYASDFSFHWQSGLLNQLKNSKNASESRKRLIFLHILIVQCLFSLKSRISRENTQNHAVYVFLRPLTHYNSTLDFLPVKRRKKKIQLSPSPLSAFTTTITRHHHFSTFFLWIFVFLIFFFGGVGLAVVVAGSHLKAELSKNIILDCALLFFRTFVENCHLISAQSLPGWLFDVIEQYLFCDFVW